MRIKSLLANIPYFPLLIAISIVVGWYVPAFYDWSGSDQSKSPSVVPRTALALIGAGISFWFLLPWLPMAKPLRNSNPVTPARFKIRTILIATTIIAVILTALLSFPGPVGGLLYGIALCYLVRFWIIRPGARIQTTALLACMYLPYIWIVTYEELDRFLPSLLWMAWGLPALLPGMWVRMLADQHAQTFTWAFMLLTSGELVVGLWMIRLGVRRAIAYDVLVLLVSTFGSFILNALVRM